MRRVQKTEWQTDNGESLMTKDSRGQYMVYVASADVAKLVELKDAIVNALALERMNTATNGAMGNRAESLAYADQQDI
jgi:hypothetical protein